MRIQEVSAEKKRLIELLYETGMVEGETRCSIIADELLLNGVIVPPCEVGQTAYFVQTICDLKGKEHNEIFTGVVHSVSKDNATVWAFVRYYNGLTYYHTESDFGKTVFLTKEEAEKALAERSGNERL